MAQDRAHVQGDAKRKRIKVVMGASAVADREINGLGGRNTQASANQIGTRQDLFVPNAIAMYQIIGDNGTSPELSSYL
jgi:hypothetical protein